MRSLLRLLALLLSVSLIAAACGDDDPVEEADDAAESTDAAEPSDDEMTDDDITEEEEGPGTIVDVAVGAGSFETLVAAVTEAGLVETLSGDGPFTVFAPTDDAFALLGTDTINSLLADVPTLTNILTYHVIGDQAVDSATAISLDGSDVEMLNGDTVSVSVQDGTLYINDSAVIAADVVATNGVIHVIDAVLTPPES